VFIMSTSIEPFSSTTGAAEPENLGRLHCAAEQRHCRTAVLKRRVDGGWQETPDWRFHRHVMRIGLYMQERLGLTAGDRIAVLSRLRQEWAVAAWAALTQGAATAVVDPSVADPVLSAELVALAPRVAFVEDVAAAERLLACRAAVSSLDTIVTLEGAIPADHVVSWSEALDLGGTLDTAERAQAFRARARGLPATTPALAHAQSADPGSSWRFLSHRDVVHRVHRILAQARIAKGDVAYLTRHVPSLATTVTLLAFTADGYTQVVIGTPGSELEEIGMTRPHKIVVSPDAVGRLLDVPSSRSPSRIRRWLALSPRLRRRGGPDMGPPGFGGRARWLSTGPALEFATRARVRESVTLEIDDSLT
jgi:hypothetical protein